MPKPKVLSVMHDVPLQSSFLTEKFVRLGKEVDMHMLVWDSEKNAQLFATSHSITRSKIHLGGSKHTLSLMNVFTLLYLSIFNSRIRKFLFDGSFIKNVKKVITYLPIFSLKPDIIHFEFGILARETVMLKKLTDAKMIASFRGYDMYYTGLDDKDYYKNVWQHADGFHFLGNDLKQHAMKRGYTTNKIEAIIPPAIDTDFFTPTKAEKADDVFNIVSVGRLTWRKGYDNALQAMRHLKDQGIPFHYTIVGDGEHLRAMQFMIQDLRLEKNITLAGSLNRDAIKILLNNSHLFLQASVSEGFCNAVIEAQAMGLPVVATDAGGLPENVVDGVTGFIVSRWDAKAMADKIAWCYQNRNTLVQMGEQGKQRVKEHFRVEDQINKFVEFYNRVYAAS
ncbi:MAG: colanic acid biosynthesis glycosyltransferase WcaL [Sphingobacteriales bacterium]|nr:MAG: colanic acid biosynthesis glycosyltransferase WcaL [Sphingobacteriales bacterium]